MKQSEEKPMSDHTERPLTMEEKAIDFLKNNVNEYEPFTVDGLNKLPFILYKSVVKVMVGFASSHLTAKDKEIADLKAELDNLKSYEIEFQNGVIHAAEVREENALLKERIEIADKLLLEAKMRWSRGDHYRFCELWEESYKEYNSLKPEK